MIQPEKIFKGTNSDGTKFTVEQWNYNTFANIQFTWYLLIFVAGLLLCSLASLILAVITIFYFKKRPILLNVAGILVGIYFWIDYYQTWLVKLALNVFVDDKNIKVLFIFNIMAIITNIICLIVFYVQKLNAEVTETIENNEPAI